MPRIETGQNPQTGLSGLESRRAAKLEEIKMAFAHAEETGSTMSSLGFVIDATERANRDVDGLVKKLTATGEAKTLFCDHTNTMQEVTLEQAKTMQLEIIDYGQHLYAKKWMLRSAAQAATTVDELDAIKWTEGDA